MNNENMLTKNENILTKKETIDIVKEFIRQNLKSKTRIELFESLSDDDLKRIPRIMELMKTTIDIMGDQKTIYVDMLVLIMSQINIIEDKTTIDFLKEMLTILVNETIDSDTKIEYLESKKQERELNNAKLQKIEADIDIIKNTSDPKTKAKLRTLLKNKPMYEDLEIFHQKIKDLLTYNLVYQNSLGNSMIHSFSSFKACIIDTYLGIVKINNLEYSIDNFDKLKTKLNISTSKLLIYAIQNINFDSNIAEFTFTDYCYDRRIASNNENRLKLKEDLDNLNAIGNIRHVNKKKDLIMTDWLIRYKYDRGDITVKFNPEFTEGLKESYMYFPSCLLRLNGKENSNLFILGYYLFTHLRINNNVQIKRNIKNLLTYLNIPTYEDVKKTDRHYQSRIIEPFDKLIDALNDMIKELNIQYEADYSNIKEFLDGYISVELNNTNIKKTYDEIDRNKKKKSIKYNTDKKETNIKLAKQYLKEGKTKKEIADLLNVSTKTVGRYLEDKGTKVKK